MSKQDHFFSEVDEARAQETEDFIAHMQRPREEVEAPDFDLPGLDDEEEETATNTSSTSDYDGLTLEYTDEQLWAAELILFKVDETIAWALAAFTGQSPDKSRKRKQASANGDDREVQLGAALLNKYQMKMSLEWAFISLFVVGYAPVFLQASQDRKDQKSKPTKPKPDPKEKTD
jgi:hypothetical protein